MNRLVTLSLLICFFVIAITPVASARDDGGFSSNNLTDRSYSAFEDPKPFDPSSIEPAAGEESVDKNAVKEEEKDAARAANETSSPETSEKK